MIPSNIRQVSQTERPCRSDRASIQGHPRHVALFSVALLVFLCGLGLEAMGAPGRCVKRDRVVPLNYIDGGQIFVPAALSCGGEAPVIVLLHGNNPSGNKHPSVAGGRHLEKLVGKYVAGRMIWPVVLAEPVHKATCSKDAAARGLVPVFASPFSFVSYRKQLGAALGKLGIKPRSYSFLAHSGSGCCANGGIYAAAQVFPRIFVFGTSDACYASSFHASFIVKRFSGTRTRVLNTCRGIAGSSTYRAYERQLVTGRPTTFRPCDPLYYVSCKRHPKYPWFAYVTKPTTVTSHDQVFTEFVKSVLFKFFRRRG